MKKIVDTLIMLLIAVVLPLIFKPYLLLTWPVWVVILVGVFLGMTQPTISLEKDNVDRLSSHLILGAILTCFVVSMIEYGYRTSQFVTIDHKSTFVGIFFIICGFLFRYWSIQVLGKFFTTAVEIQNDHKLVRIGPYKYLRHPSYLGAWVGVLGVPILLQSFWGIIGCLILYFPSYLYRIKNEESALQSKFPLEYQEYREKTWKMIPFIF